MANYKNDLLNLIKKVSYREGDFTLSSGKKSTYYIDLKATTLHPDGAFWIGECAADWILSLPRDSFAGVGGLTLGADPIATAVSLACRARGLLLPAFIVRKEPKKHGTSRYIEGVENLKASSNLLVLEDVVTTGKSSLEAVQKIRESGYRTDTVFSVVDRMEGGGDALRHLGLNLHTLITLKDLKST